MPSFRIDSSRALLAVMFALAVPACALGGGGEPAGAGSDLDSPWVVDGRADGAASATFVRCTIEPGTGDPFFRQDTLRCAPGTESWLARSSVQVSGASGYVGTLDLTAGEASATYFAAGYPLQLQISAAVEGIVGLEASRVRKDVAIARADELATWRAIEAPFDVWPLDVESRTTGGVIDFDARDVALAGATLDATSAGSTLVVRRAFERFGAGERRTLQVAVERGAHAVTGSAGSTEGSGLAAFTVERAGAYVLAADGLVRREDVVAPPGGGPELVRCRTVTVPATDTVPASEILGCGLVVRTGIAVGAARIEREAVAATLPLDGSFVDVGPRGTGAVALRAVVTGVTGIAGFASSDPVAFDDAFELADGASETAVVLPFDLLHARFVFAAGVARAFFDADAPMHITLRRPWTGRFDVESSPRLAPVRETPDAWIAVEPGRTAPIAGRLAVVTDAGSVAETALALAAGDYLVNSAGAAPAVAPASGTELARCWLEDSGLLCELAETAPVLSVTLSLTLEGLGGRRLDRVLHSGRARIVSVSSLLPLGVALRAEAIGIATPVVAEAHVTAVTDLPVTAPLVARAP